MKTMKYLFGIMLLVMFSMTASADDQTPQGGNDQTTGGDQTTEGSQTASEVVVITNDEYKGGKVEVIKKDGRVVTITVTPSEGYYIEKSDVEVIPVKDPSTTRAEEGEESLPTAGTLELTLVDKDGKPVVDEKNEPVADAEDLTQARNYQFTVPEGLGAWISKAGFSKVGTEGKLGDDVTWSITTSEAKAGETATVTLTLDGKGAASIKEDAAAPWDVQKTKITNVVVGAEITELGKGLLSGCTALVAVEIKNDAAIVTLGENAIPANKGLEVDVPGNLFNEYETTDGWKTFKITSTTGVEMKDVAFEENNSYDTFCSSKKAVKIPSVLKAFVITAIKDNAVVIEEIKDGVIPAGVPVLLLSKQLKSKKLMTAAVASETKGGTYTSLLKVAGEKGETVTLGSVYLLYNDVFYLSMAGTIPAGGIYLPKPETKSGTRSALVIGGDGTTAIDDSHLSPLTSDFSDVWYDLSGRRLSAKPTAKGVYIMNGKKVVIK
jgi:hypothetical protein